MFRTKGDFLLRFERVRRLIKHAKNLFLAKPKWMGTGMNGGGEMGASLASTGMAFDVEILVPGNETSNANCGQGSTRGGEEAKSSKIGGLPSMSELHMRAVQPCLAPRVSMFKLDFVLL